MLSRLEGGFGAGFAATAAAAACGKSEIQRLDGLLGRHQGSFDNLLA